MRGEKISIGKSSKRVLTHNLRLLKLPTYRGRPGHKIRKRERESERVREARWSKYLFWWNACLFEEVHLELLWGFSQIKKILKDTLNPRGRGRRGKQREKERESREQREARGRRARESGSGER